MKKIKPRFVSWAGLCLMAALALSACGGSDQKNSGGEGGSSGDDASLINQRDKSQDQARAKERWPESGSYSYDFSFNGCKTGSQSFDGKAGYCLGLTDRALNQGCALEIRRGFYKRECGDDFEERNIRAAQFSGYDLVLQKSCTTAKPANETFYRLKSYCDFLKDETLHQSCLWSSRKSEFQSLNCSGEFSAEPKSSTPEPAPTSTSTPTPEPTQTSSPTPLPAPEKPAIVQELEAAGIKVQVLAESTPLPGDPPFEARLADFWKRLASQKDLILSRKAYIQRLSVGTYTSYASKQRVLSIGVDLAAEDMESYFPLLDRRIALEKRLQMNLFLGVEVYRHEADKTAGLLRKLRFFESWEKDLSLLKHAIRLIMFDSYGYYSFRERSLQLSREDFENQLKTYFPALVKTEALLEWADGAGVEVMASETVDVWMAKLVPAFEVLLSAKEDLDRLKSLGYLKTLSFSANRDRMGYSPLSRELRVPSTGAGFSLLPQLMKAMANQAMVSTAWKLEIENRLDYEQPYLEAVKRLMYRLDVIQSKKSLIQRIVLGGSSSFSSGTLTIGARDLESNLDHVLSQITGSS